MRSSLVALSLAITLVGTAARAEVPLLTPAELQQEAQHIVTGKVQNVYATEKTLDKNHVDTLFAVEVVITEVEKGEGIAAEQVVFAKAWRMKKRERGWAGPSGQDSIPKRGETVKLYLTGNNGAYDALSPNGIQIVKQKRTK